MSSKNKPPRRIYVVGDASVYRNWMQGHLVYNMDDADLVVFTGGEDVSSGLYNQPFHPTTSINFTRDINEKKEFDRALALKKPMIGICRGAQFLCVMAGGMLVQHQDNPHYFHGVVTYDGRKHYITSTHHQAQYPWKMNPDDYRVLGWSSTLQSPFHLGGLGEELVIGVAPKDKEVEMAFYPKINALGIQGHPEAMLYKYGEIQEVTNTIDYLRGQLNLFLEGNLLKKYDNIEKARKKAPSAVK